MQAVQLLADKKKYVCREAEYNKYFETTNGILCLDQLMRIKNLNHEAERICSIERGKIIGKRADVVFQDFGPQFLKAFDISEYEDMYTTNARVCIKDQFVYLHVDSLKIFDSSGQVNSIIIIIQDVSAVHAAIKQIQTTQMLLSLGELAAGVAHHVRTPLTTISGYLQVMLNRLKDDQYTVRRDILETLLDEVSYINDVVKELVLYAKPPIKKKPDVSVNHLIDQALLLTFKQLGGENVTIQKQLAAGLPTINADSNLLEQAIVNVLQNAMEAMAEEGILSLKSWLNADLNMIVIAITDNGTGVSQDVLARVFEPFYTTKLDRMGLGLPVAHRIVAEHGGFINIGADQKGGTKVHIYLPIVDARMNQMSAVHQQILNLQ